MYETLVDSTNNLIEEVLNELELFYKNKVY